MSLIPVSRRLSQGMTFSTECPPAGASQEVNEVAPSLAAPSASGQQAGTLRMSAQEKLAKLSGTQAGCYAWAVSLPEGFRRRSYRAAGFTDGTVASLVGLGLLFPDRHEFGVCWYADVWSVEGRADLAKSREFAS